ncbi:hypothetical protein BC940DRAFT_312617 [Gongronella butleri]|nr:hypothetical protein BC940DRAFT_312617 [Gongronella butleri]
MRDGQTSPFRPHIALPRPKNTIQSLLAGENSLDSGYLIDRVKPFPGKSDSPLFYFCC